MGVIAPLRGQIRYNKRYSTGSIARKSGFRVDREGILLSNGGTAHFALSAGLPRLGKVNRSKLS